MPQPAAILDNPVWHSLTSHHSAVAIGGAHAKRYPDQIAPFIAVAGLDPSADAELAGLVAKGEMVHLVGIAPPLSAKWSIEGRRTVVQMTCEQRIDAPDDNDDVAIMSRADLQEMLDLTALTYPEFFRTRTQELGTYRGIRQHGRLVAMAGERMRPGAYREISAVCTHPDFLGRGYARRLIVRLVNDARSRGETSFLHVAPENSRARSLYERLGFVDRAEIPLLSVRLLGASGS